MKNKLITTAIIILLIIIAFLIIFNFLQHRTIKQNEEVIIDSRNYISDLNKQIEKLKSKPPVTVKEFIKLTDEAQVKAYEKALNDRKEALQIAEDAVSKLKDITKSLEQCNKALKRKNKIAFIPLAGIGLDNEFNITGQLGGMINGVIYNGLFIDVAFGGGGSYSVRYDFNEVIHGGNILINFIFYF